MTVAAISGPLQRHHRQGHHQAQHREGHRVKEFAASLGIVPRALRAFPRKTGRSAGRGTTDSWPSLNDSAVRKIAADYRKAQEAEPRRPPPSSHPTAPALARSRRVEASE